MYGSIPSVSRRLRRQIGSFLEQVKAPDGGTCEICNKPLGGDPYYIVNYPDGEHVNCWQEHIHQPVFPYDSELGDLRILARHLIDAYSELVDFGKWLSAIKRGWPQSGTALRDEYRDRRIV